MKNKVSRLKKILDESNYTVALCGSGMMEEGGYVGVKKMDRAYDIEKKYGYSAEELFSSAFYNTRPEQFFEFYRTEMLFHAPKRTASSDALAAMEQAGKLQFIIDGNMYELNQQAGCKRVLNLHGSIYKNKCPRCRKEYPLDYMIRSSKLPLCDKCKILVRPQVSLFGEMVDSQLMTKASLEVAKADVLVLLGTNLNSEVFHNYINYFKGCKLVIIHQRPHYLDERADLVIVNQPKNVLPLLKYDNPVSNAT